MLAPVRRKAKVLTLVTFEPSRGLLFVLVTLEEIFSVLYGFKRSYSEGGYIQEAFFLRSAQLCQGFNLKNRLLNVVLEITVLEHALP